ncbi:MAG: AAA family ATPase, partial [Gemmatimonadota bacterium]
MLRIRLFGGASIEAEDGPLSGPAAQRHRLALLALLAVAWPAGVSRDKLIASLWPERDARRARNLLSQAVHAVRKALGEEVVTSAGDELRFDREVVACDLLQFRAALAVGDDARAADLKRGPFLDGFFLPDAPGFEHWLDEQRARIAREHARALERLATGAEERCDSRSAAEWWHRLLELDPYSARAVIRLMDALASAGDRAEAIRLADAHGSLVRSEFGAEPNPDVVALADRLRRGKEAGSVTRPSRVDGVPPARLAAQLPAPGWALIGRDAESERLSDAWRIATTRGAHVAVISGEPGIGKTRLAEELFLRVRRNRIPAARTRSWAVEGRLAYAPVTEWLWSEALHARLAGLDPAWLAEVSHLLPGIRSGRSDIPEPEPLNDGWRRRRLFDALIQVIRVRQDPLLLLLDDLQWTDPDTLQWIHYLVRTEPDAPVLFVGTLRPGELSREHALPEMLLELRRRDQLTEIALGPLDRDAAGALASRVAGRDLSATETARLHRDTDGNPLFVIESVRAGLDEPSTAGGAAERDAVSYRSPVNAVIRARLARLSGPAHRLAGFAATIGREFTSDVL